MINKIIVLIAVVTVLGMGSYALASHSNPNELHACYKNNNGQMRFVADPADCLSSETDVTWNQQGTQGPQGPQGPVGPAGTSTGSISNFEMVHTTTATDNTSFKSISRACPTGKQVISGGFDIQSPGGGVIEIVTSAPYNSGWHVRARASAEFQGEDWALRATALCATITP